MEYPALLDLPRPRLRAYRPETAIAEKVHAMVVLGSKNSRMRDFFDVHVMAMRGSFDGESLTSALASTFARRRTAVSHDRPIALTPDFAAVEGKAAQWQAFLRRSRLESRNFTDTIEGIEAFVGPVLDALAARRGFTGAWPPGGPWRQK